LIRTKKININLKEQPDCLTFDANIQTKCDWQS